MEYFFFPYSEFIGLLILVLSRLFTLKFFELDEAVLIFSLAMTHTFLPLPFINWLVLVYESTHSVSQAILILTYVLDSLNRFKYTFSVPHVVLEKTKISKACTTNLRSYAMFLARFEPPPVK